MNKEVSVSDVIYNFDKCLSCLLYEDISDFNLVKSIRLKYSTEELDTSTQVIRESTEIYLIILDCFKKIRNFLSNLNGNFEEDEILEKLSEKYQKIYISKSGKDCLPPGYDGVDRRKELFFDEFDGKVFRYYNFLTIENKNKLRKKILNGDYRIEEFLFMVDINLSHYLSKSKNKHKNLNLSSYTISKMDIQDEKILYNSQTNFETKITMIYFLENISRIYGIRMKKQGSDVILLGDKNSIIFFNSSIDYDLVYPPLEISQYMIHKYPRYIIKCHYS